MARATPGLGVEGPGASLLKLNGVSLITSGSDAKFALLGGRSVGEMTLNRFYVLHCVAIPLAAALADHDPLLAGPQGRRDQRADVSVGTAARGSTASAARSAAVVIERRVGAAPDPRASSSQQTLMHHQDLTPGVLAGLAWYYLLAAMLNAAAAAYVAYGEMVSEGASRSGLAPRTRRLPDWLIIALLRPLRPGRS